MVNYPQNATKEVKVLVVTEKLSAKIAVGGIKKEIEGAGFELTLPEKYTDKAQLPDTMEDVNATITRGGTIDVEVLGVARELKIIVRAGIGYNSVDLNAATAYDMCIINTPGQNPNAVAELAFGSLVYIVRNSYSGMSGTGLMGKKLGIHAYGNVGCNVTRIAKGFGTKFYVYNALCPRDVIERDGVKAVGSAEELYEICNIVSPHIPATVETKNSINHDLLKNMSKGAILVNTARKEMISEDKLIQLMEERPDLKYIIDIMPVANAKLTELSAGRYFPTPKKIDTQTTEANINTGIAAAKQVVGFLEEGCEKFRMNK